jgi:hypothetical protein
MRASTTEGTLPEEITRVVVFDTNAYRVLTYGCSLNESKAMARNLADAELAVKTKALANPFVIWELISHLADTEDPAYQHCLNALVALVEHTRLPDDETGGVCRVADGETELCRQLFQQIPSKAAANTSHLCQMASYIWQDAPLIKDPAIITNINTFSATMAKREAAWLDQIEALLHHLRSAGILNSGSDSSAKNRRNKTREILNSPDFAKLYALAKVENLAALLDLYLSPAESNKAAERLLEIFPSAIQLMTATIASWFDAPDINLRSPKKKRGNFVWDTALCLSFGKLHKINNASVLLVTGDQAIHDAASAASCPNLVVTLDNYQQEILSPSST